MSERREAAATPGCGFCARRRLSSLACRFGSRAVRILLGGLPLGAPGFRRAPASCSQQSWQDLPLRAVC